MFTIALSRIVDRIVSALAHLGHRFAELVAGIGEARQLAHRFKMLSQMTDAELAARGLKREDIPQAVLNHGIRA